MSFFKRLFSGVKTESRENWPTVVKVICDISVQLRAHWFSFWLTLAENQNIVIKNRILGGTGEAAMKAYQLIWITYYLSGHGYIKEADGRDFADLLWGKLAANQHISEVMPYVYRYQEKVDDLPTLVNRFGSDVAAYITGDQVMGRILAGSQAENSPEEMETLEGVAYL